MRYYFHVKDGTTMLDDEGSELDSMDAVKSEAVMSSVDMLRDLHGERFWAGEPWTLWVTNQPNGGGDTVLTLTFSSRLAG